MDMDKAEPHTSQLVGSSGGQCCSVRRGCCAIPEHPNKSHWLWRTSLSTTCMSCCPAAGDGPKYMEKSTWPPPGTLVHFSCCSYKYFHAPSSEARHDPLYGTTPWLGYLWLGVPWQQMRLPSSPRWTYFYLGVRSPPAWLKGRWRLLLGSWRWLREKGTEGSSFVVPYQPFERPPQHLGWRSVSGQKPTPSEGNISDKRKLSAGISAPPQPLPPQMLSTPKISSQSSLSPLLLPWWIRLFSSFQWPHVTSSPGSIPPPEVCYLVILPRWYWSSQGSSLTGEHTSLNPLGGLVEPQSPPLRLHHQHTKSAWLGGGILRRSQMSGRIPMP